MSWHGKSGRCGYPAQRSPDASNVASSPECHEQYQGDGTDCFAICFPTTTTTAPDTTTTTEYLPPTTTVDNTTTTTTPDAALCGDANDDGEVSSVDALITLRTSVGISSCPETRCDYNGNGDVQSSDALAILRVSVGQTVAANCPLS